MNRIAMLIAVGLGSMVSACACADDVVPPPVHPDSRNWEDLFRADLSDAIYPQGVWHFEGGVLTATKDENIWTKKEYGDCIIDLEFKTSPSSNSGVFVYGSDLKNSVLNSVEIQLADDFAPERATHPKNWRCGAIMGRVAPSASAVKRPGEWNRMTVTCLGSKIYVLFNGQQVTEIDMKKWTSGTKNPDGSPIPPWLNKPLAELPTHGHIGLQGKHHGNVTYFRNVKVKSLDSPR